LAYLFFVLFLEDNGTSDTENLRFSGLSVTSELKVMLAKLLDGAKDILANVQEFRDQIYADFEYAESQTGVHNLK